MQYRTQAGDLLEAENLRQLAEALWQSKFDPEPTLEAWMAGSARRAAIYNGSVIRTCSPEAHVQDLIRAGFLMRQDEPGA